MLLTKDNILRFVQKHKYTTPTIVSKEFDTTTTIASAALGELVDGINIETTHIKFGTTPYYYDPKQKQCLEEIAQKSFSENELELFNKIRKEQIVALNTLSIPQRSIVSKLKDIYYEIKISKDEKEYTFFIWFMRNEQETRRQIQEALFPSPKNTSKKATPKIESNNESGGKINQTHKSNTSTNASEQIISNKHISAKNTNNGNSFEKPVESSNPFSNLYQQSSSSNADSNPSIHQNNSSDFKYNSQINSNSKEAHYDNTSHTHKSCDNYLFEHGYTIIEKEKHSLGSTYKVSIPMNEFILFIDCLSIEQKKIQMREILEFYTSSLKPKIIFHSNLPKKILSTIKELENCFIIEVDNEK